MLLQNTQSSSFSVIKHQPMPIYYSKTYSIIQSRPCSSKLLSHQASNNVNSFYSKILSILQSRPCSSTIQFSIVVCSWSCTPDSVVVVVCADVVVVEVNLAFFPPNSAVAVVVVVVHQALPQPPPFLQVPLISSSNLPLFLFLPLKFQLIIHQTSLHPLLCSFARSFIYAVLPSASTL